MQYPYPQEQVRQSGRFAPVLRFDCTCSHDDCANSCGACALDAALDSTAGVLPLAAAVSLGAYALVYRTDRDPSLRFAWGDDTMGWDDNDVVDLGHCIIPLMRAAFAAAAIAPDTIPGGWQLG